jgi:hypothetical protein
MFGGTRSSRPSEDPSVARIEAILEAAAARNLSPMRLLEDRPRAAHAMWICACETMGDAPTWLIYATNEGEIVWCRVPDALEPLDLVDARLIAGGHADPGEVLLWLQGRASEPWSGGGWGDEAVPRELGRKIPRS